MLPRLLRETSMQHTVGSGKVRFLRGHAIAAVALAAWLLTGCNEDTVTSPDAAATDSAADAKDATVAADAVADVAADVTAAPDVAATCGALPSCLTANKQEDLGLCPKPGTDYVCITGCCVKKELCKSQADCTSKLGKAICPDVRFTCACDLAGGQCVQSMCSVDSQCAPGQICSQGGCSTAPATASLKVKLLRPWWLAAAGAEADAATQLGAQASDDKGNVVPVVDLEWQLTGTGPFALDGLKIKATQVGGGAVLAARVKGSTGAWSNPAALTNLGPLAAGKVLRVRGIDDVTALPLTGKVVVVGLADATTPAVAVQADLVDGSASFADIKFPCDIHVLTKDHAPVSVLRLSPAKGTADLVLPTPLNHFADLVFDDKGLLNKEKSKLVNADLVTGKVAYPGVGEASLALTSLAFGTGLLNFNIASILGPDVKRPFDDEALALINPDKGKPQDIPGGVTFELIKPVVRTYVLASTPGPRPLWTLSGHIDFGVLMPEISKVVNQVASAGLDIGSLVSVLLPYLNTFQSQVVFDVPFAAKLTEPLQKLDLSPKFPLGLQTEVQLASLPKTGEGAWADLVFVIGGALLPSGDIIPLGLTAGADKHEDSDAADGKVDSNKDEPGPQPLGLSVAPLHSGVRVGTANHVLVTAAIVLGGKGKKEGGSLIIGVPGVIQEVTKPGDFLPFPLGSSYSKETGLLTVQPVAGAQFYRTTFIGGLGAQWLVLSPASLAGKSVKLPDLTVWGATEDLGKQAKRVLVGAFELHTALDFETLVGPTGLSDLVRLVKRTAFIDSGN